MTQVLLKPETWYLLISSKPLLYIQKNAFDLYKEKKYSKEIQASGQNNSHFKGNKKHLQTFTNNNI